MLHLRPGAAARCIARFEGPPQAWAKLAAAGEPVATLEVDLEPGWVERSFDIPARLAGARTLIEIQAVGGPLTTYHYWCMPASAPVTPG